MVGATVCVVEESRNPAYTAGDVVLSYSGWQTHAISDGRGLRKLDPSVVPVSTALGVLGMPGFTAYAGLLELGRPKPGETVVVAAATGPVGSAVGQIARLRGARAVGIAGGPEKQQALLEEFGFDEALDHRSPTFADDLAAATPDGIDVYFENVGGHVAREVFRRMNLYGRVPVCGLVADYNATSAPEGPDRLPGFMRMVLTKSLMIRGFIQAEFERSHGEDFVREMSGWVADGSVRYREDVAEGLDATPRGVPRPARRPQLRQGAGPRLPRPHPLTPCPGVAPATSGYPHDEIDPRSRCHAGTWAREHVRGRSHRCRRPGAPSASGSTPRSRTASRTAAARRRPPRRSRRAP